VIADVLEGLNDTDPVHSGMSGSGATCYALYKTAEHRDKAAAIFAAEDPDWWQMSGRLR
jgi:4-diphosphocytidyl-2-C-methyl-D-erythritol kinase